MEFLFVKFDDKRFLVIDDAPTAWETNEAVLIQAGPHVISLSSPPANFSPPEIEVDMINTSVLNPKQIRFEKV